MKTSLYSAVTTLLLILATASSSSAGGTAPPLKAKISGTVQTQLIIDPTNGRIQKTALNNKLVFEQFAVSADDYDLVLDISGGGELDLVPKLAASALPTIQVLALGATKTVIDTKTHRFALEGPVSSTATGTLFEGLAGEIAGTASYKGAFPPTAFSKLSLAGQARGTNVGGATPTALIRFKISTAGLFVQQ